MKAHAEEVQRQALARVGARPDASVSLEVAEGMAGVRLVEAARTARLLVVGSRPIGPIRAALLGSVSRYCAHRAGRPVVVVPDPVGPGAVKGEAVVSSHTASTL